jgi:ABC-type polysaccharide/polyol phosphate transport system ATPase subunit
MESVAKMKSGRPVISIDHVSKVYRIYRTSVDRLRDAFGIASNFKQFSALDDVSFDVRAGEFWGIIGKNGSGKSTLLKIVAGQMQSTDGDVRCEGRTALLQLGLGFDPDLTGRENVRQARLLQNLSSDYDEIADFVEEFSELGDFIDYPVKTYSSGMYSRLAFATAIAGNPDILIADEVLAVGDMNFTQKCLAKMREFKDMGKTVLLVTHDINMVKSFCDHALWLHEGKTISVGPAKLVADDFRNYMMYGVMSSLGGESQIKKAADEDSGCTEGSSAPSDADTWTVPNAARRTISNGKMRIQRYRFVDPDSRRSIASLSPHQTVELEIVTEVYQELNIHSFGFTLHDRNGMIALHLNSEFFGVTLFSAEAGRVLTTRFAFDAPTLADGEYSVSLACSEGSDGVVIEKYDYDSIVSISWPRSPTTDRQGGYVIVPSGSFTIDANA